VSAPVVSILLPARDAAATLPGCLASIRRQSEARFECVIADDGSRDATPAVAERIARADPRFRILRLPARGLVEALNAGLATCRGEFVARMDADDLMHRHRLARQLAALRADPGLAGLGCHVRVFPRAGLRPGLRDYERWLRGIDSTEAVCRERFVECPLPHPTWLLRREALAALGYRERGWPEDYDLLLRLFASGRRLGVVPERLLAWRDAPGRMWRSHPNYTRERLVACKAEGLASSFLRRTDRYVLWGYGDTGKALRRALLAHGKRPGAIVELHPGRLRDTIHGACVVRPESLPALAPAPLVVSVAGAFARGEIRAQLARLSRREGVDYVVAA